MIPFAARLVWCATFGGVGMFPFGIDVMDWLPLNMWKGYTCAHEVAPIAEEKWYQGDATDPEGIITPKAVDLYWIKPDPAVWGTWPPRSPTAPEVILVVFGGGYIQGHPLEGDRCHEIARLTGITVLTFKYRTAIRISGAFPAALQDIITAYAFLMSRGVKRLAIIGDSAGAGLSLALLQHFSCLASSGTPFPPPSRLEPPSHMILYSPWVDLTLSSPSIQSNAQYDVLLPTMLAPAVWLYSAAARSCKVPTGPNSVQNIGLHHPLLSPALDSSVDSLKRVAEWSIPEILVSWGSVEILDDEIMQLCENFQKAGFGEHVKQHRWDGEVHVFQVIPSIFSQKRKEALAESVEFLLLGAGGGSDLKESLPGSKHQVGGLLFLTGDCPMLKDLFVTA
ncbi:hypothetical protein FRB96_006593 [Tulasnella sp. 330]|nr:hypothetical protein FRB96_006593 [Tulasnella sp. 330]KAG8884638.1 hypothetical protein FRB97_003694 [Tulasnella sp. 331]